MSLVDRLINAIQEQDVLYTIVWIKEIKEDLFLEGDLGQKINKLHSTEDCTPFSAAVELCESPLREIILQILLLSGADFRGCRIWAKTQEMTRRLTQVLQAWERGGKNQAHDAEMLLKLPLEEAADWIDEHLPLPPNANSLTGAEIPLPPSPRSTPILASVSLQSPPCISFSLPDARARHNSGRSAGGEKQGQVDEILKSRNKAAPIVSIPVKDAQHLAHLPSPPPTAELAATASFSSPLRIRSPPSENAEPSSSPAQQSSNSRSPRIPNADFAKSSLIRSPSRTQSPQRLSSPLSRPRPIHHIVGFSLAPLHLIEPRDVSPLLVDLEKVHSRLVDLEDALHLPASRDSAHPHLDSNGKDLRLHNSGSGNLFATISRADYDL
ncbi:hypothetical protein JCM5353_000893 [Sporobolomyces roseus]